MGKSEPPKPKKRAAIVTPEDPSVTAAGQRVLDEQAAKTGRDSTVKVKPRTKTGFAGIFPGKTGSV